MVVHLNSHYCPRQNYCWMLYRKTAVTACVANVTAAEVFYQSTLASCYEVAVMID